MDTIGTDRDSPREDTVKHARALASGRRATGSARSRSRTDPPVPLRRVEIAPPDAGAEDFARVLQAAILARGLALNRLRDHLAARGQQVGVSTLSYWQNGARRPTTRSLPVIQALEEVLEVSPGTLTTLLPVEAESSDPQAARFAATRFSGLVEAFAHDIGLPGMDQTITLSVIERLVIGQDGALQLKDVHQVVRAMDDIDRRIVTYQGDEGCDVGLISLTAVSGCRIGRTRTHPEASLLIVEMLFERQLRRHEPHVFQYAVHDTNLIPTVEHYRLHIQRGGIHVAEIEFHPDRLPTRIEEFYRRSLEESDVRRRPVQLQDGNRAYLVTEQLVPGVSGLSWTYGT